MCVCMRVCVYACMHACMCTCVCTCMFTCVHAYVASVYTPMCDCSKSRNPKMSLALITGFYSVVGAFTICGIHGLPPYLYFFSDHSLHPQLYPTVLAQLKLLLVVPIVVLGAGRLLSLAVEVSVCGCVGGRVECE